MWGTGMKLPIKGVLPVAGDTLTESVAGVHPTDIFWLFHHSMLTGGIAVIPVCVGQPLFLHLTPILPLHTLHTHANQNPLPVDLLWLRATVLSY
jgi:hypothetical protein